MANLHYNRKPPTVYETRHDYSPYTFMIQAPLKHGSSVYQKKLDKKGDTTEASQLHPSPGVGLMSQSVLRVNVTQINNKN